MTGILAFYYLDSKEDMVYGQYWRKGKEKKILAGSYLCSINRNNSCDCNVLGSNVISIFRSMLSILD